MSLIEVLISLLLLSSMLFGFVAADMEITQEERVTYVFSTAENQIINMIERLMVLRNNAGLDEQVAAWNKENEALLPKGVGSVSGVFPLYFVTVFWGEVEKKCQKKKLGETGCIQEKIQLE